MLLLVKLQDSCNFTKSNNPPWVFFTFLKLYKWYQTAQSVSYVLFFISDKVDLAQLKEQLRNALASVNAIARRLILRAVDRFHNSLITLGDYIRPLLTAAGKEDGKAFL